MRIATHIVAVLASLFPCAALADNTDPPMSRSVAHWSAVAEDVTYAGNVLVFTPPDDDGSMRLPLLISLHGLGHRGDDVTLLERDHICRMIAAGRVFPALVLCPQARGNWSGPEVAAFIDHALATYADRIDPDRVYLTGASAGGGGAWEGAKLRPDKLAAVVPICPYFGDETDADRLARVPVWLFHNVHDPYCPVERSQRIAAALRAADHPDVRYTEYTQTVGKRQEPRGIYPNTHRHAWETAYADEDMWTWLFAQRRGEAAPP
jgi:predicted peptidase